MKNKLLILILLISPALIFAQKSVVLDPDSAEQGQNLVVSITGTNTNFSSGSNTLQFYYQGSPTNQINSLSVYPVSNTSAMGNIFVQGSATIGAYTYKLINLTDGLVPGSGNFYVTNVNPNPQLTKMIPSSSPQGRTVRTLVSGRNIHSGTYDQYTQIYLSRVGIPGTITGNFNSSLTDYMFDVEFNIPSNAPTGFYDLHIVDSIDGNLVLSNAFNITMGGLPDIISITPNTGIAGTTLSVTITGTLTQFNSGSPTVYFFQQGSPTSLIEKISQQVVNDSLMNLTIRIANNSYGVYGLFVNDNLNTMFLPDAFLVYVAIGLNEKEQPKALKIYPNPAHHELKVESEGSRIMKYEIMDLVGRILQSQSLPMPEDNISIHLDDAILPDQMYLLRVYTSEGTITRRIRID